ncbi:fumarylacetoacetate hydrolase family protein [Thauera sp. 63]|uniref:fumarylacetoacetate hydrolase family protein n=1 Tax=Thauera sp. 63 TaxID=497321 RepID=UPI0002CF7762|nr:fumarylacetoacetate hydrolase family protein [Thauera sp. 63]ENO79463.1 Ureidoglycolate lyase [Thauera sp. 63]
MKLVTFTHAGKTRVGKVVGDRVVDISVACPSLPHDMRSILSLGDSALAQIQQAEDTTNTLPLSEVKLEAPILNPSKFLAIGMNYADHVEESARKGIKAPDTQVWFNKQVSCVAGPFDPVVKPNISDMLDYEVELCVVIGKRCKNVSIEDALSVVAGYMVTNDFSVRDVQWASPTWTLGKSFDTHGPIGPWIVTSDEITDPYKLRMRLTVNGEVRQNNLTGLMVYNISKQIAHLTSIMTLEPGDLIATGTPMGVGAAMDPVGYLKVGDVVRAEIEGIGAIENKIVSE